MNFCLSLGITMNTFPFASIFLLVLTGASLDGPYFPVKIKPGDEGVSKFEADWYGKSLEQMKEPQLPILSKQIDAEAYRILILPTWGNSVAVRVQKHGQLYSLSARRLSGQAGYDPGGLAEAKDLELGAEDSKTLDGLIQNLDFFQMPTTDSVRGFDGDEWILEGVRNGKYRVVQRWCATSYGPEKRKLTAFLALFRFLLDKSALSARPSNKGHKLI